MRYRKRVLFTLVGLLVFPLLLDNTLIFSSLYSRELRLKRDYVRDQALQLSRTVDFLLSKLGSDFIYLSYKRELRNLRDWYAEADYRERRAFLEDFDPLTVLAGWYDEAFLVDANDGMMIDLKNKLISPISKSRNEGRIRELERLVAEHADGGELLVLPDASERPSAFYIKTIPIPEEDRSITLYVRLSEGFFRKVLDEIFLVERSFVLIADRDNGVVTMRARDLDVASAPLDAWLPKDAREGAWAQIENPAGKFLVTSVASPEHAWLYHYGIDSSAVSAAILSVLSRFSLLSLGVLAVCLVAVRFLSRGMYQPVLGMAALLEASSGKRASESDMDELEAIRSGIRGLVERNRELARSLQDTAHFEREALLRGLLRSGGASSGGDASGLRLLGFEHPDAEDARWAVCVGMSRFGDFGTAGVGAQRFADLSGGDPEAARVLGFDFATATSVRYLLADDLRLVFVVHWKASELGDDPSRLIAMEADTGRGLLLGVSAARRKWRELHEAWSEALVALEYRSLFPGQAVLHYGAAMERKSEAFFYPADAETRLLSALRQRDEEGVAARFELFRGMVRSSGLTIATARHTWYHLADSLLRVARDFDLGSGEGWTGRTTERIERAIDAPEMEAAVEDLLGRIIAGLASERESPMIALANRARAYIDAHYGNRNLGLDLVADELKYSVSHLSSVFKDAFGETMKDYIIGLRLTKAKELLVKTDEQVSRVGAAVGYDNLGSFVKIFKAYVGETPKEYRLRVREK